MHPTKQTASIAIYTPMKLIFPLLRNISFFPLNRPCEPTDCVIFSPPEGRKGEKKEGKGGRLKISPLIFCLFFFVPHTTLEHPSTREEK